MTIKYESRKFIDLIQRATSKWANWDPPKKIEVGDYGTIMNETGEFDWEGNIYSPHFQKQFQSSKYKFDIDLTDSALRPYEQEARDDHFVVKSWGVTTKQINASAEVAVPGVTNVALKLQIEFDGNKPAAVLVMHKPRYSSLPNDERIIQLIKSMSAILKEKYIVTEVISCAAYMMHLSDQQAEKFSVTLKAVGPVTPATNTGGAASFTWSSEAVYGLSRQGSDPAEKYMPLYRLKQPRPKFWDLPSSHHGDEKNDAINRWEDVDPTWNPLDDEGEEQEIYDAEMHGDFGVFNDGYPDNDDDDY
jgi:hypothetical protein